MRGRKRGCETEKERERESERERRGGEIKKGRDIDVDNA